MKRLYFYNKNQGFSSVELLITMVVAAILLAVAAPNFSEAMLNSRQVVKTNELMSSLRLARSEAIKRSTRTAVCARETNTSCGGDWSNGFIVFVDDGATAGTIEDGEQVLRVAQAIEGGSWILNRARLVNTSEAPLQRAHIRFGPRGNSHWRGSGYFAICDGRGQESARAINITLSGDPRRARMDGDTLLNSFGGEAACGTAP